MLVLALAMFFGVVAQVIARHARVPGIVLLLAFGVLLGPDVANLIRPEQMGPALGGVVGFAVAIILFEGGLSLNIKHLRAQAVPIRRLVTVGAVITGVLAALAAKVTMGWEWRIAILFGTLVIVTGPTVITPLLRRIKVKHNVEVVLEAEGIFIDAVGATIAVVALEVVLAPKIGTFVEGIAGRLLIGTGMGAVGGAALALVLRWRNVIPEGLENIFGMAAAVALFEGSNAFAAESGIIAVIVMGVVVGNTRSHALDDLKVFEEQLTVLLIATLFVLLAADVRVEHIQALGWNGVLLVCLLMFVVRPITIFGSCYKTDLTNREKAFIAWLGPRGIVAAAVASLFAQELAHGGFPGGYEKGVEMRAMVFLVIATTVLLQGLSGGWVASLLKVRRASNQGYLILGANKMGLLLGQALRESGQVVEFIDSNPARCKKAERGGFTVHLGNGLDVDTLAYAHADARIGCLGVTPREDLNFLFAQKVRRAFKGPEVYVALETEADGVTESMVRQVGVNVLFGTEVLLSRWIDHLRQGTARAQRWELQSATATAGIDIRKPPQGWALPMVAIRKERAVLIDQRYEPKQSDMVIFAVEQEHEDKIADWLEERGWRLVD